MLGLVDLLRAVRGTVSVSLRRVNPVAGLAVIAVVWLGALGVVFSLTDTGPTSGEESSLTGHNNAADRRSTTTDDDADGDGDGDGWGGGDSGDDSGR